MRFPLGFDDVSILLVVLSVILLVTSEFMNPLNSKINFVLDKKRLRRTALALSFLFLITLVIRIYQLILIT